MNKWKIWNRLTCNSSYFTFASPFLSIQETNGFSLITFLSWTLFLGGSYGKKKSACNTGDLGSVLGLGRSSGKGIAMHSSVLTWRIP